MLGEKLEEAFHKWWGDVCIKVNKALVFLDSPAAESLHWNGGLHKLISAGASNVKAFSPFERGEKTERKAVFVITSPLLEEELHILQAILQPSSFIYCIVVTTVPEYIYSQHIGVEKEHYFYSVETKLLNWMGNQNYTAEIVCVPVTGMTICRKFFLMPAFHAVFPQLFPDSSENTMVADRRHKGTLDKALPLQKDIEIKALAHSLNVLFEYLHVKEDIFSVGHLSSTLGLELESLNSAKNRRKTASTKVSLVLVDRTLDLAGVLSQNCQSMLDRVIRVLPHLPGHTCDVAIDMSPLCASNGGEVFGLSLLAPGCLADDNDSKRTHLTTFISKKQKDCLMTINRHLVEKANVGSSSLETGCPVRRLTSEQLQKQVLAFRDSPESWQDNIGLLQYALAIVQTLQHPNNSLLDEMQSTEQLLIQNLATSGENAFQNLIYLLSNRKQRSLSLVTVITLIAYLYALEDDTNFISILDEQKLQAALVGAIFQDADNLPPFLMNLIGDSVEENNVISTVNMIFQKLKSLSIARKSMKKYKSVFERGDIVHPAFYAPLLKQLLEDIFNTSLTDLPDVEYHSAGLKEYLKSSFSLFMNVAKPQPRDNPTIILLVLGGITATEVNQIREISEKFSNEVIVGSTVLVTPHDIIKKIFKH